jgi:hypothetical protein
MCNKVAILAIINSIICVNSITTNSTILVSRVTLLKVIGVDYSRMLVNTQFNGARKRNASFVDYELTHGAHERGVISISATGIACERDDLQRKRLW